MDVYRQQLQHLQSKQDFDARVTAYALFRTAEYSSLSVPISTWNFLVTTLCGPLVFLFALPLFSNSLCGNSAKQYLPELHQKLACHTASTGMASKVCLQELHAMAPNSLCRHGTGRQNFLTNPTNPSGWIEKIHLLFSGTRQLSCKDYHKDGMALRSWLQRRDTTVA